MPEYWTVGELARRAGVTVRTIQFYDQQKLLAPSAKGPQNRRLYSEEDERELQRILVLKFLGNSLSDIRRVVSHELDGEEFEGLIDQQVEVLGHDLARLMRRMAALRAIRRRVRQGDDPDWAEIAHTIDPSGSQPSAMRHSQHESAGVGTGAVASGEGVPSGAASSWAPSASWRPACSPTTRGPTSLRLATRPFASAWGTTSPASSSRLTGRCTRTPSRGMTPSRSSGAPWTSISRWRGRRRRPLRLPGGSSRFPGLTARARSTSCAPRVRRHVPPGRGASGARGLRRAPSPGSPSGATPRRGRSPLRLRG